MDDLDIRIRPYTVQIQNSWKFSKKKFDEVLDRVHKYLPTRTKKSLKREWAVHNLLYNLGYKRDKTGHVDFNYKLTWYQDLVYRILGLFSMIFIK